MRWRKNIRTGQELEKVYNPGQGLGPTVAPARICLLAYVTPDLAPLGLIVGSRCCRDAPCLEATSFRSCCVSLGAGPKLWHIVALDLFPICRLSEWSKGCNVLVQILLLSFSMCFGTLWRQTHGDGAAEPEETLVVDSQVDLAVLCKTRSFVHLNQSQRSKCRFLRSLIWE